MILAFAAALAEMAVAAGRIVNAHQGEQFRACTLFPEDCRKHGIALPS
jgi:hypothetical protein